MRNPRQNISLRFLNRIKQTQTASDDAAQISLGLLCHAPRSELRGDIGIGWWPERRQSRIIRESTSRSQRSACTTVVQACKAQHQIVTVTAVSLSHKISHGPATRCRCLRPQMQTHRRAGLSRQHSSTFRHATLWWNLPVQWANRQPSSATMSGPWWFQAQGWLMQQLSPSGRRQRGRTASLCSGHHLKQGALGSARAAHPRPQPALKLARCVAPPAIAASLLLCLVQLRCRQIAGRCKAPDLASAPLLQRRLSARRSAA